MAYINGRFNAGSRKPRNLPPLFSPENQEWVSCLGFERDELIDFLEQTGVRHSLVRLITAAEIDSATPVGDEPIGCLEGSSNTQDGVPHLGVSTPDIADAFAGLGEWDAQAWRRVTEIAWAQPALMQPGRPGKNGATRWNPVQLAQLAMPQRDIKLDAFGRRFRDEKVLASWLKIWQEYEENERWYGGKAQS